MNTWRRLIEFLDHGERVCRIAITGVEGSSPREAGATMLVTARGGFTGTIGGGALEWQALALAQRLLAENPGGKGISRSFSLGPDLGQCCGGRVTLLFEALAATDRGWIDALAEAEARGGFKTDGVADCRGIFLRKISMENSAPDSQADRPALREQHGEFRTPLLLFGAGHVGRALVLALAPLPFAVRWVDVRPDAFPGHHPANTTPVFTASPADEILKALPGTLMLAMTHSHALDLDLVAASLANPAIAFTGVIGSATKRARFASQLRGMGLANSTIDAMVCPIGAINIAGKEPAVIAAGIVVQLLEAREKYLALNTPAMHIQPKRLHLRAARRLTPPA